MRILLVNKFHYLKGGSEKYYFELADLLKQNGHEVAFFSMNDEKNIKTDCKEYFVDNIDMNNASKLKAIDVIYSKKNKKKMQEALEDFKPNIVHLNNFQRQLSASIIDAITHKNIPIIYTAHDLQSACPASIMLNKGEVCEKCKNNKYINCFKNKCMKDSSLKSLLAVIEAKYYKHRNIYNKFSCIITPSDFVKNKIIGYEIPFHKIQTLHNYIDVSQYSNINLKYDNYAFYFGRLSREKGILNLIEAFSKTDKGNLYIAGTGPEEQRIQEVIKEKNIQERVKLLGFLSQEDIKKYLCNARFVVVPSIWYENCPFSILESFVMGKAVVGANIGGIPELIEEGKNGFLYDYKDIKSLSKIMVKLFLDSDYCRKLGNQAREICMEKYSKKKYYEQLERIYKEALEHKESIE